MFFLSLLSSLLFSSRSLRSVTPPQPQSWVTTLATTSSPALCHQTPTRPRPWWTSSRRWGGTTCPRWPQRATTERAAWRPSFRSRGKLVGATFCFVLVKEIWWADASFLAAVWITKHWYLQTFPYLRLCGRMLGPQVGVCTGVTHLLLKKQSLKPHGLVSVRLSSR